MSHRSAAGTFYVPKELLAEAKRAPRPGRGNFRVEGWRRSWLSRLSELLIGKG